MKPITIQGKRLLIVPTKASVFECIDCACDNKHGGENRCVRLNRDTNELYFEKTEKVGMRDGQRDALFCIDGPHDIVFINDTPEDIARYVSARLDKA